VSASAPTLVRTFRVGPYTATLTAGPNDDGFVTAVCEWLPHMPKTLTATEEEQYQRGLAAFATELGRLALSAS